MGMEEAAAPKVSRDYGRSLGRRADNLEGEWVQNTGLREQCAARDRLSDWLAATRTLPLQAKRAIKCSKCAEGLRLTMTDLHEVRSGAEFQPYLEHYVGRLKEKKAPEIVVPDAAGHQAVLDRLERAGTTAAVRQGLE